MDFRGYVPSELVVGFWIIVALAVALGLFVARDFVIPFLESHVAIR